MDDKQLLEMYEKGELKDIPPHISLRIGFLLLEKKQQQEEKKTGKDLDFIKVVDEKKEKTALELLADAYSKQEEEEREQEK